VFDHLNVATQQIYKDKSTMAYTWYPPLSSSTPQTISSGITKGVAFEVAVKQSQASRGLIISVAESSDGGVTFSEYKTVQAPGLPGIANAFEVRPGCDGTCFYFTAPEIKASPAENGLPEVIGRPAANAIQWYASNADASDLQATITATPA